MSVCKTDDNKNFDDVKPKNFNVFLQADPFCEEFSNAICKRYRAFQQLYNAIKDGSTSLDEYTKGYEYFGMNVQADNSIICREWAPNAKQMFLLGDFNDWRRYEYEYTNIGEEVWELVIPPKHGECAIQHLSEVKVNMVTHSGDSIFRNSPYTRYAVQNTFDQIFKQRFWNTKENVYTFKYPKAPKRRSLRIYECHVGVATNEFRVGTYLEFTRFVLPRISDLGYNAIQLMAIMEHAYYASFGYQVTSFYAPSSRFGTPNELKELIDTAHRYQFTVILDIVHSHASKNVDDGLNEFDGSKGCFFHVGDKGEHSVWDSRLFNYRHPQVMRFLLSNIRYYMEEFRIDGFRFDGVTSIMYKSHGINKNFTGDYRQYFGDDADFDGMLYLMIANAVVHHFGGSGAITIAEDVSGMPGLCRPLDEGGFGFNYRLAMAIPDMWIQLMKKRDEDWNMESLTYTLTNRRFMEPHVAYCESHDQSLVGDKTLSFWLMDSEMYTHMSQFSEYTLRISRGIALHKLIRFLTFTLGGEAYMNFMGNEFGHPEWLDFPREGNNNDFKYARRQWHLVDDNTLRYCHLNSWDIAMNHLEEKYQWLDSEPAYVTLKHNSDKIIAFERAQILFVFNFHSNKSYEGYAIGVSKSGVYRPVLHSDETLFGGWNRIDCNQKHFTTAEIAHGHPQYIKIYIPARTAIAFVCN